MRSTSGGSEAELALEVAFGARADRRRGGLPVLEEDHRRDRHDPVAACECLVLVDVHLDEVQLAGALVDDLLQHRRDRVTRTTPLRPEIDEDGCLFRALDHLGLERGLADVMCHVVRLPFPWLPQTQTPGRTALFPLYN